MEGTVAVVSRVAREADVGETWLNGSVQWVLGVLRQSGKADKSDALTCLDASSEVRTNVYPLLSLLMRL